MAQSRGEKKQPAEYKRRTREHIIAALSVNSVERLALLEGHTCNRPEADYGYDLQIFTFDDGAFENGFILLQLKATDNIRMVEKGSAVSFSISCADLRLWNGELYPVILIVWDAQADQGYWLYVQEYLEKSPDYPCPPSQATLAVHIPITNVVNAAAIKQFRQYKNAKLATYKQATAHND